MEKLTIVKVLSKGTPITEHDLERWRQVFAQKMMTPEQAVATGQVSVEEIPPSNDGQLVLVKVGGDDYVPTAEDLDTWKKIFEEAMDDSDFKIFTHENVTVEVIDIGQIIAVE
jgi:hypothetical protein